MKRAFLALAACLAIFARPARADPSSFDLAGPSLRIMVTRQGITLPIGSVPQLAVGDKLKLKAELPPDETARYLLVAAFLREPTNPPPDKWFWKSASWKPAAQGGGAIELTIPAGAQHLVLFLAPATGGDFSTLRAAVKARPGAFVRAAQDLEQASLDHSRYDAYLTAIRKVAARAPDQLAHLSPVVASSLRIKINEDCLQRQPEFQLGCLLDAKQSLVPGNDDNAGSSSLTAAASDLALSLSATPAGGLGYYSPYISTIRDIFGIFSAMHTAKYQYIPALGVPRGETMGLVLNTPPSFASPKSVLMAALPEIRAAHPPELLVSATSPAPCLGANEPRLPIAIGPLFYATDYARDLTLRIAMPGGGRIELPVVADVTRGGLAISGAAYPKVSWPVGMTGPVAARIHGMWGFEPFTGPDMQLETARDWHWQAAGADKGNGQLLLTGGPVACISAVTLTTADGGSQSATWKIGNRGEINVTLPSGGNRAVLTITGPAGTAPVTISIAAATKVVPPAAVIVAQSSEPLSADAASAIAVVLDNPHEIPADTRFNFTLRASGKDRFDGRDTVEIGAADGGKTVKLTEGDGLTRVDADLMVASVIPAQALGASAFGPLRARVVRGGVAGDWLSLETLVRLPRLKRLTCPTDPTATCTLAGNGMYLLASVAATSDFEDAISVPEGYPGFSLAVPHPAKGGMLYVRLHDAPEAVNHLSVVSSMDAAR